MSARLETVIRNNNDLYEAVFKSQGIFFERTDAIWCSRSKVPPYYSNIVTRSCAWRPDATFEEITATAGREHWRTCSIKDSFDVLDLSDNGFSRLFTSKWIYLPEKSFTPSKAAPAVEFRLAADEGDLLLWRSAWEPDLALSAQIFGPSMLRDPTVHFVLGYEDERLVCGCLINRTDHVLGVSNFFSPSDDATYWSSTLEFLHSAVGRYDVVGYESFDLSEELQVLGFECVGDLTVWLNEYEH
jgi:hypothetical protein